MNTYNIHNISTLGSHCMATVGMFDGVHVGHRHIIDVLNAEADRRGLQPVVVTFDTHPRLVLDKAGNGFALLSTIDERQQLLALAGARNTVLLHFTAQMASLSACQFLGSVLVKQLGVKALLLGYDNQFGSRTANDFGQLPQAASHLGVELLADSAVSVDGLDVSSTQVRRALAGCDVVLACRLLGRPYQATGRVVQGRQVGRTLGFPTANLRLPDPHKALPAHGVYAALAGIEGRWLPAMANIGAQPTFGLTQPTFEVHIIDFEGDLYNRDIDIRFVRHLRPIVHFNSPQELVNQLTIDKNQTLLCTNN